MSCYHYEYIMNSEFCRGCPSAVVRVWPDPDSVGPPVELCGETLTNETREIISTGNSLKVSTHLASRMLIVIIGSVFVVYL